MPPQGRKSAICHSSLSKMDPQAKCSLVVLRPEGGLGIILLISFTYRWRSRGPASTLLIYASWLLIWHCLHVSLPGDPGFHYCRCWTPREMWHLWRWWSFSLPCCLLRKRQIGNCSRWWKKSSQGSPLTRTPCSSRQQALTAEPNSVFAWVCV